MRIFPLLLIFAFYSQAYAGEPLLNEPIRPLQAIPVDAEKVILGELLFHEPRLSADNSISCAHCHNLSRGGSDNLAFSMGVKQAIGEMNAPTVFNAAINIAQFWDGRAKSLEDQIDGPTHKQTEMASNWPDIIAKLNQDKTYIAAFNKLYDDGISAQNIKHAIAEFERSLITLNSRFDQYLLGATYAITLEEKKGYALFKSLGCASCHQGANVGGNFYQTLGIFETYFGAHESIEPHDFGRFNVTNIETDRFKFKVPSLRLVTLTAPYFHDGSHSKLKEAIDDMGEYQLGIKISDSDIASIIAFLHTLKGEHPALSQP